MEVPQDFERSVHWYRLAADQGDPIAQTALGNMYHDGRGVSQDYEEAARWYQLAKAQGSPCPVIPSHCGQLLGN